MRGLLIPHVTQHIGLRHSALYSESIGSPVGLYRFPKGALSVPQWGFCRFPSGILSVPRWDCIGSSVGLYRFTSGTLSVPQWDFIGSPVGFYRFTSGILFVPQCVFRNSVSSKPKITITYGIWEASCRPNLATAPAMLLNTRVCSGNKKLCSYTYENN